MSNKMKKKQVQNQAQEGRSMVEMLGVLAVIGVISIGGISGYRMAMNRYQANQIANEINLMRTDAKMKVARGVELLLGEPYDGEDGHLNFNANYGVSVASKDIFDEETNTTETGYSFTLSGIPAGVCQPLATLLDGMDDTAALEINGGDYTTTENLCSETENEVMVAFSTKDLGGASSGNGEEPEPEVTDPEQADQPQDEPECNEETCAGGVCQADGTCKCNDENEYWTGYGCTACPAGARQEDGTCECTEEGSHLKGSRCIMCPEEAEWSDKVGDCVCKEAGKSWTSDGKCIDNVCNTNGEGCADDEYCDMSLNDCSNGNPVLYSSGHTCKKAEGNYRDIEVKNSEGGKKTIYKSNSTMDWWAADAFCQALGRKLGKSGMHLVSLGDLGCPKSVGSYCPDGSYGKSLASKELSGWGWTSTPYPIDSCTACNVYLSNGNVNGGNRNGYCYALCE